MTLLHGLKDGLKGLHRYLELLLADFLVDLWLQLVPKLIGYYGARGSFGLNFT